MPGHTLGVLHGSQGPTPPPQVLVDTSYCSAGGGVLMRTLLWRERCDAGGATVAHHIKCYGGRSVPPLGIIGGINNGGEGVISNDNDAAQP